MLPFLSYRLKARKGLTIILYHAVAPKIFRRHLRFLKKRYNIIKMFDYLEYRRNGGRLPDYPLVITLDDGHRENYLLLPILRETGVPITIFLCSSIAGTRRHFWFMEHQKRKLLKQLPDSERLRRLEEAGYSERKEFDDYQALSTEEVFELSDVVDFQSHSVTHPILPLCSAAKSRYEIVESRRHLELKFDLNVNGFSFPDGKYTSREIEFVREAGYQYALTLDPGFNSAKTDLFHLRRINIPDWAGVSFLWAKCSGVWHTLKKLIRRRNGYYPL